MRFSERIGKRSVKSVLQVEMIDTDLKNRLWNTILEDFFDKCDDSGSYTYETIKKKVCRIIWKEFCKKPIDEIPQYRNTMVVSPEGVISYVRNWFYGGEWFDIYDLIEFLAMLDSRMVNVGFINSCNTALKKEVSGYRIVNERIVQITSEEELQEIEEAQTVSQHWRSVNQHLQTALDMLADRKTPDYRNSIKESISAVEALCIIVTGDNKATLGKALTEIEKKHPLHGSLKSAFSAFYGYTSDSGGIRHALLEDDKEVGFEDAKFMLVSCSAFINYLKAKTQTN